MKSTKFFFETAQCCAELNCGVKNSILRFVFCFHSQAIQKKREGCIQEEKLENKSHKRTKETLTTLTPFLLFRLLCLLLRATAGNSAQNVVDTENQLRGLRRQVQHAALDLVALRDAQSGNIRNVARAHVQAHGALPFHVSGAETRDKVAAIETSVVGDDCREHAEGLGEGLHGKGALALSVARELIDGDGHLHLAATAAQNRGLAAHRLAQHAQSIVDGALGLVEDVLAGAAEDDRAGLSGGEALEAQDGVLADHNLVDLLSVAVLDVVDLVEGGEDVSAEGLREAFDALEVRVLDGHDAGLGEQLFGVVVDELAVDEAADVMLRDLGDLLAHLRLLSLLDVGEGGDTVDLDLGAEHLDLVRVHGGVRDQNLDVLEFAGLPHADLLVEEEAGLEVGLGERAAELLHDVDHLKVRAALQTEHGIDAQLREVLLLHAHDLRAQRRAGDVHEVLAEGSLGGGVVDGALLKSFRGGLGSEAVAVDNRLGVDVLLEQKALGAAEKLAGQHCDGGGAIADLVVLGLGHVDEEVRGGVVDEHRLEDRCAVVCDADGVLLVHALQDLVHALGTEGRLDEVRRGDGAHDVGELGALTLLLGRTVAEDVVGVAVESRLHLSFEKISLFYIQ
eukprot:PhM_4_TR14419/c0_g1_i1/m.72372